MAKNSDPDKYSYSGYRVLFDVHGTFSLLNGGFGKNLIILGADINSSVHVDNKKGILILSEGPTQALDDTTLIAEAAYFANFTGQGKKFYIC